MSQRLSILQDRIDDHLQYLQSSIKKKQDIFEIFLQKQICKNDDNSASILVFTENSIQFHCQDCSNQSRCMQKIMSLQILRQQIFQMIEEIYTKKELMNQLNNFSETIKETYTEIDLLSKEILKKSELDLYYILFERSNFLQIIDQMDPTNEGQFLTNQIISNSSNKFSSYMESLKSSLSFASNKMLKIFNEIQNYLKNEKNSVKNNYQEQNKIQISNKMDRSQYTENHDLSPFKSYNSKERILENHDFVDSENDNDDNLYSKARKIFQSFDCSKREVQKKKQQEKQKFQQQNIQNTVLFEQIFENLPQKLNSFDELLHLSSEPQIQFENENNFNIESHFSKTNAQNHYYNHLGSVQQIYNTDKNNYQIDTISNYQQIKSMKQADKFPYIMRQSSNENESILTQNLIDLKEIMKTMQDQHQITKNKMCDLQRKYSERRSSRNRNFSKSNSESSSKSSSYDRHRNQKKKYEYKESRAKHQYQQLEEDFNRQEEENKKNKISKKKYLKQKINKQSKINPVQYENQPNSLEIEENQFLTQNKKEKDKKKGISRGTQLWYVNYEYNCKSQIVAQDFLVAFKHIFLKSQDDLSIRYLIASYKQIQSQNEFGVYSIDVFLSFKNRRTTSNNVFGFINHQLEVALHSRVHSIKKFEQFFMEFNDEAKFVFYELEKICFFQIGQKPNLNRIHNQIEPDDEVENQSILKTIEQ